MPDIFELTGFQRDILYVVAGLGELSGQAIKDELQKEVGDIGHGRLYPNLDTLVERGFVDKGSIDRRTNAYRITEGGLAELQRRRTWEDRYVSFDD
jgi:DNA-binding PadR family transcriptional regulator